MKQFYFEENIEEVQNAFLSVCQSLGYNNINLDTNIHKLEFKTKYEGLFIGLHEVTIIFNVSENGTSGIATFQEPAQKNGHRYTPNKGKVDRDYGLIIESVTKILNQNKVEVESEENIRKRKEIQSYIKMKQFYFKENIEEVQNAFLFACQLLTYTNINLDSNSHQLIFQTKNEGFKLSHEVTIVFRTNGSGTAGVVNFTKPPNVYRVRYDANEKKAQKEFDLIINSVTRLLLNDNNNSKNTESQPTESFQKNTDVKETEVKNKLKLEKTTSASDSKIFEEISMVGKNENIINKKKGYRYAIIIGIVSFIFFAFILPKLTAPDVCDCVNNAIKITTPQFDANLQKKCEDYSKNLSQKEKVERVDELIRRGCFSTSNKKQKKEVNINGVYTGSTNIGGWELKAETIDGTYTYSDNSVELEITISGDSWYGKTMIVTGFGSDYDSQNAQYDNGIVNGNDLYESSGTVKIGYVSGKSLTTSIGGQRVTLRKK